MPRRFHKLSELLDETLGNPHKPMPTSSLTLPTVHLNGTSRKMLADDYGTAYRALIQAREAFAAIEFNARDYYVAGPDAFSRARTERDCALQKFSQLIDYLEAHLIHLGE